MANFLGGEMTKKFQNGPGLEPIALIDLKNGDNLVGNRNYSGRIERNQNFIQEILC